MIKSILEAHGFNVGLNCGLDAGQSVMHVHMHLIPRYKGDVENPRGGVDPGEITKGLKESGMNAHYYVSPETAHEWQTWRRSLYQFAQLLFK